jgi:ssDNA-binding Zn-finger/Zn-ribbon topoisomerase 1
MATNTEIQAEIDRRWPRGWGDGVSPRFLIEEILGLKVEIERLKPLTCKECKCEMVAGKALVDKLSGIPDFIGDDYVCTVSASGKADLVDCLKCPECGYSVTKGTK